MPPLKRPNATLEAPIVRIVEAEAPSVPPELVGQLLCEINPRQWGAVLEVLLEAKYKAESMLRLDSIYESPGKVAHYQGWVTYADYVIGSLTTLRETPQLCASPEPEPGPLYDYRPH